jgi:hypothetical protein
MKNATWMDIAKTTGWLAAKVAKAANDKGKELAVAVLKSTNNRLDNVKTTAPSSVAAAAASLLNTP